MNCKKRHTLSKFTEERLQLGSRVHASDGRSLASLVYGSHGMGLVRTFASILGRHCQSAKKILDKRKMFCLWQLHMVR